VLRAGDHSLRVVFHFHGAPGGKIDGSLDSLDQGAMGIPCSNVKLKGQKLTLEVPAVHGTYSGTLSADGNKLSGTWMQGAPLTLDLTRQAKAAPATAPAPAAAAAPVPLKDLKPILDKEFAPVIAAWPQAGIVVGVLDRDERKVFAYGAAQPDSIFEIGSITKTFTALALAQMVEQHTVTLDEPVRELLPAGTVTKPASGPEITLLDLATHRSGLPRSPNNLRSNDRHNPFAGYETADLYAFMKYWSTSKPTWASFSYSNLGFGLLGQALMNRTGVSYANLVNGLRSHSACTTRWCSSRSSSVDG